MAINSKIGICNMALNHLGNYGTIDDIDSPKSDKEKVFALVYDNTRQMLLKTTMPNFALARKVVSQSVLPTAFGYRYAYEYPADCLKLLGVGDIDLKLSNHISVESLGGSLKILSDDDYTDGMEIRYIKDITDVNAMAAEFKDLLALYLAEAVAMTITQDMKKKQLIASLIPQRMGNLSALNAQENPPIRRSESRFRAARYSDPAMNRSKK